MKGSSLKRIVLFLITNLAVVLLLGVIARAFGLERYLVYGRQQQLDLGALLIGAAVMGFGGAFISLALSKTMAKMFTGATVITSPRSETEAWLVTTVQRLARSAQIECPEVAIYDSPEVNAFATGARRNHALVAVSTGLLSAMNRDEAEAVLAHEVSHAANGDMVTLTLIQGVVNTFVIFLSRIVGYFVDRVLLRNERRTGVGYWITVMVAEMVFGILATMIVMAFSRHREFRADAGAASLVGSQNMIAALERLRRHAEEPPMLPKSMNAFGIRGANSGILRLFMSHPPIEERILALQNAGR